MVVVEKTKDNSHVGKQDRKVLPYEATSIKGVLGDCGETQTKTKEEGMSIKENKLILLSWIQDGYDKDASDLLNTIIKEARQESFKNLPACFRCPNCTKHHISGIEQGRQESIDDEIKFLEKFKHRLGQYIDAVSNTMAILGIEAVKTFRNELIKLGEYDNVYLSDRITLLKQKLKEKNGN